VAARGVGLGPLAGWDCGFEAHREHGCLSLGSVCFQVEVSATSWSLVQMKPTECGVSESDRDASLMRPGPQGDVCATGRRGKDV